MNKPKTAEPARDPQMSDAASIAPAPAVTPAPETPTLRQRGVPPNPETAKPRWQRIKEEEEQAAWEERAKNRGKNPLKATAAEE